MKIELTPDQATILFDELVARLFEHAHKTSLLEQYFWQQNQEVYKLLSDLAVLLDIVQKYENIQISINCLLNES